MGYRYVYNDDNNKYNNFDVWFYIDHSNKCWSNITFAVVVLPIHFRSIYRCVDFHISILVYWYWHWSFNSSISGVCSSVGNSFLLLFFLLVIHDSCRCIRLLPTRLEVSIHARCGVTLGESNRCHSNFEWLIHAFCCMWLVQIQKINRQKWFLRQEFVGHYIISLQTLMGSYFFFPFWLFRA